MVTGTTGRLIVHIGDHKTGTTSIQELLAKGLVSVDGKSLFYPSRLAHNQLARQIARGLDVADAPLTALIDRICRTGADFTILSAEAFEDIDPKQVRRVRDSYFAKASNDIVFVGYLRPHASRIASSYAEQLKLGVFDGDLDDFFRKIIKSKRFHYAPRIKAWHQEFGEAYVMRPLVREALKNGSVVEDFFHTALGGAPFAVAETRTANPSLGIRDLMLLKLVHRHLLDQPLRKRHELGWTIATFLGEQTDEASERLYVHRDLAERIAKSFEKDARAVDSELFSGRPLLQTELQKAVDTAPVTPQSLEPEDYFSASERRAIYALSKSIDVLMSIGGNVASHLFKSRVKALHDE